MENIQEDLLPNDLLDLDIKKRDAMVPVWIKIFSWLFLIFGAFVPVSLISGILGYNFQLSLYGIETNEPLSITGVFVTLLFLLKAVVAFGLLKKTDWAVSFGLVDAALGIVVCFAIMFYPVLYPASKIHGLFRLELLALIPYFLKLKKIRPLWMA